MRTGAEYLRALNDGRDIRVGTEKIDDVTTHPAFRGPIKVIADTYDIVHGDSSAQFTDPDDGQTYSGMWRIPRTSEDISARRHMHEVWANASYGLMGRTPDHVASLLSAYAGSSEVFAGSDRRFEDNVKRFYQKAREEDLYLSYAIVPPQVDRSKAAHEQPDPYIYPGIAEEREDGIVIRGAQMIATSAAMADWLLLTYIVPLGEGDERYSFSCVMPMNTPGLRLYPRRPYPTIATSDADYPLSTHFDEFDALVVFDDAFIPWENVFIYRDVSKMRAQFVDTGAHVTANFQALSRFCVKLRFACGLAMRLTELHGINKIPPVQGQLGHGVATIATQIEAMVLAAEKTPEERGGILIPSQLYVYTGMSLQRQLVSELMRWLRELAGGSFICVPATIDAFDADDPSVAEHMHKYFASAGANSLDRVHFLKLMWDIVGTEFAGRQLQYEMFYSAPQHVCDARVYGSYDWDRAKALVADCEARFAS